MGSAAAPTLSTATGALRAAHCAQYSSTLSTLVPYGRHCRRVRTAALPCRSPQCCFGTLNCTRCFTVSHGTRGYSTVRWAVRLIQVTHSAQVLGKLCAARAAAYSCARARLRAYVLGCVQRRGRRDSTVALGTTFVESTTSTGRAPAGLAWRGQDVETVSYLTSQPSVAALVAETWTARIEHDVLTTVGTPQYTAGQPVGHHRA